MSAVHRYVPILISGALALVAGCTTAASREAVVRAGAQVRAAAPRHEGVAPGPATDATLDARLSGEVTVETLLEIALARHPALREALARAEQSVAGIDVAGALNDPRLVFETEGAPRSSPLSLTRSMANKLRFEQSFPWPGVRDLRVQTSLREADAAFERYRIAEREIVGEVKRAWSEYFMLAREREIHLEHVTLQEEFSAIAESKYKTGTGTQQDLLRPQLERAMLHNEVVTLDQRIGSIRASLNTLLNRPPDSPLGSPSGISRQEGEFDPRDLGAEAMETRAEVQEARLMLEVSRAMLATAGREARSPEIMVGLGYRQIPGEEDAWDGMVAMTLPWWSDRRPAGIRVLKQQVRADEFAVERVRAMVLREVQDASLRVRSSLELVRRVENELLPKAQQMIDVIRAAYRNDRASSLDLLEAERSLRDLRMQHVRAQSDHATALADLERAVGREWRSQP